MSRPNKCIKDENGNDCWISRSTVVIPIVFKLDQKTGDIYTLVEKRGYSVSHPEEWCCPCGFIDWDESLPEACQREVREETGIDIDPDKLIFFKVESDKESTAQTVDLWYFYMGTDIEIDKSKIETIDEVLDVQWLKVGQVFKSARFFGLLSGINVRIYKPAIEKGFGPWAFKKHPQKIVEMLRLLVKN